MHAVGALVVDRVRAHLVEEPQVAAFADVVVVHRPEHRAEGVGVGHPPVAAGVAGAVLERLALRWSVSGPSKKPASWRRVEGAGGLVVEGEGLELVGAVDEGAGDELAAGLLRAEHREGIAVRARDDRLDLRGIEKAGAGGSRRLAPLHGLLGHQRSPRVVLLGSGYSLMPQMSSAYCRMVRSDENQPIRAVFRIAFSHQAEGSDQSSSTARWALA